ncbi:uncharacterized protein ARMOST_20961 [Armillaria ostoyae]|uniref:F-box domain-containing protein n=1 Tax=Armillaria ostoyae TaxID=47428 RepID=A0A284S8T4_ARMOS|nr:uncharacterized protein ARMOST_20961 [Armillaria ostoyae]
MPLPTEIFEEIVATVDELDVLQTFTLACRAARYACQPILWERLDVAEHRNSEFCLLWFRKNSHLARETRIITFLGPGDHDPSQAQVWYNFDLLLRLVSQGHKLRSVVVARFQLNLIRTSQIFPCLAATIGEARLLVINCTCDHASFADISTSGALHLLFSACSYTNDALLPPALSNVHSFAYDSVNSRFQCPLDALPVIRLWTLTTLQVHIFYNQVPWLHHLLRMCEDTLNTLDCRIAYDLATKSIGLPVCIGRMRQLRSATFTSDISHSDVLIRSLETIPACLVSLHIILSLDNRSLSDDMKSIPEIFILPSTLSRLVVSIIKKHPYALNCVDDQAFAADLRLYLKSVFASISMDVSFLPPNSAFDVSSDDVSDASHVGPRYGCRFP